MVERAFPELTEQEEEALKEESRVRSLDDLHYLAKYILGYDRITDHIHKQMAMDVDMPDYKFKLLLWPRSHFKSTIATESYSIQTLLRDPTERILITNAKLENSRKFLRAIARHFQSNPKFRWCWRDWWLNKYATNYHKSQFGDKLDWITRATQDELVLLRPGQGREASITTGSTDASLVSQHYSKIIADDLINRDFVRTADMVEKSILYFKDLLDLLTPEGELILIGTRWSHADLYSWIIDEFGGIASLRVPQGYVSEDVVQAAEATPDSDKKWLISIMPTSEENPIFPEEFGKKELQALLHAKGPYEYSAQYLLNPTPEAFQKFKEEWFVKVDTLPDLHELNICITVDPAASVEDYSDRSAIAVCGYDSSNRMYFLDGLNDKVTEDELLDELFELASFYQKMSRFLFPIGFEAVGFQQTYVYNFERMMMENNKFFAVEPIKRRAASKEERILRLVPRIKNEFYIPKRLKKFSKRSGEYDLVQRLLWELLKFPFAGYDDLADALADQLDLVHAQKLPVSKKKDPKGKVVDFVHPSIIQDRSNTRQLYKRKRKQSFGAVR
jgi:hypothetical protein